MREIESTSEKRSRREYADRFTRRDAVDRGVVREDAAAARLVGDGGVSVRVRWREGGGGGNGGRKRCDGGGAHRTKRGGGRGGRPRSAVLRFGGATVRVWGSIL
jgi:hypothetical protein